MWVGPIVLQQIFPRETLQPAQKDPGVAMDTHVDGIWFKMKLWCSAHVVAILLRSARHLKERPTIIQSVGQASKQ